jgi:hypothetical protein
MEPTVHRGARIQGVCLPKVIGRHKPVDRWLYVGWKKPARGLKNA